MHQILDREADGVVNGVSSADPVTILDVVHQAKGARILSGESPDHIK